jgi:hypothetical protein
MINFLFRKEMTKIKNHFIEVINKKILRHSLNANYHKV